MVYRHNTHVRPMLYSTDMEIPRTDLDPNYDEPVIIETSMHHKEYKPPKFMDDRSVDERINDGEYPLELPLYRLGRKL